MARVKHSQKLSAPLQNHFNSLATPAHDDSSLLPADSEEFWCFCQQPESGEMTASDHVHCPIVWFHTACVQVKRNPKETGIAQTVERSSLSVKTKMYHHHNNDYCACIYSENVDFTERELLSHNNYRVHS